MATYNYLSLGIMMLYHMTMSIKQDCQSNTRIYQIIKKHTLLSEQS